MTDVLYVGDRAIRTDTIPTLLKRYDLLPKFLEELAIDAAIEEHPCTAEEKHHALVEICQQNKLANLEDQQKWMDERGLSAADVEAMATRSRRIQKFKEAQWGKKVRRHFMERKAGLDTVVYSLVRTQDGGLAQELYYRILEGEISFEECAATYSKGPEIRTGGKLGPVPLNRPHPVISKLLSVSQPGQLWPPRIIADWHIIIRLEQIHHAQLDDATRQALLDELYNTWLQAQVQTLTAQVLSPEAQAKRAAQAQEQAEANTDGAGAMPDCGESHLTNGSQDAIASTASSVNHDANGHSNGKLEPGEEIHSLPARSSAALSRPSPPATEPDLTIADAPEADAADRPDTNTNASQSLVSTSA